MLDLVFLDPPPNGVLVASVGVWQYWTLDGELGSRRFGTRSILSVGGRENGKATTHSLHSRTHPRSPQKHERDDGMNGGGRGTALRVLRRVLGRRRRRRRKRKK